MMRDRAEEIKNLTTHRGYESLLDQLIVFAQGPSLVVDTMSAFNLFWNGRYSARATRLLDKVDLLRFFDWYVFDYPTWQAQKPVIALFQESIGLAEEERAMLASWQDTVMSLYRIEEIKPGERFALHDLVQDAPVLIQDVMLSRVARREDLIIGRVLQAITEQPGESELRLSAAPILLPQALQASLLEMLNIAWKSYQETHYQADQRAFLRASGHLFNHYLLQHALAADGKQPLSLSRYYSASRAIAALQRAHEEDERERAKRVQKLARELREQENVDEKDQGTTVTPTGLILPSDQASSSKPRTGEKTTASGKLLLP
jgi:hypothetical protein